MQGAAHRKLRFFFCPAGQTDPALFHSGIPPFQKDSPMPSTTFDFNRSIAEENQRFFRDGYYETRGKRHDFPARITDVTVYPASAQPALIEEASRALSHAAPPIIVKNSDTFSAAEETVLNFASDWQPGGGYLYGSSAQEECLCRQSTLYASLTSPAAAVMYDTNQRFRFPLASDTFLFSPYVEIFRAAPRKGYTLRKRPRVTSVLTVPAPDLRGDAGKLPLPEVRRAMRRRMRAFLAAAWKEQKKTITLGAWGCGVFGHDARHTAEDFRAVLVDERYQSLFETIVFAVYADDDRSRYNLAAFEDAFGQ